jgi:hypothetical protein
MVSSLLALVATLLAAPALTSPPAPAALSGAAQDCSRFRGHWISSRGDGSHSITRISDASHCLEIHADGTVDFTDDDGDVARLSPGGAFSVEETRGATTRRIEMYERAGRVERTYWVNGERRPPEEASGWLREVIPAVARESVAGADRRAERVLRARGPRGVLQEVGEIASDEVKRIYLGKLLDGGRQPADVLRDVARVASERIVSDGVKGDVLRRVAARAGGDASVLEAVVEASRRIVSDGEKARVLLDAVGATSDARVHAAAAAATRNIVSDGRRGEVLAALAGRTSDSPELRDAYFRTARAMVSDSERRRALLAALEAREGRAADAGVLAAALDGARQMVSDTERGQVLRAAIARGALATPATRDALFRAVDAMVSDGERSRVLLEVARQGDAAASAVAPALRSVGRMTSDNAKATVLIELATRTPALRDSAARGAFFDAVRTLTSSGEYRRVMEAVLR